MNRLDCLEKTLLSLMIILKTTPQSTNSNMYPGWVTIQMKDELQDLITLFNKQE